MSLFHTHRKYWVIIMLITITPLFYWANAYENGFLNVFSTGNLLNSCTLWQYHFSAKERKLTVKMSTQKFSTQFTAKDIDFLHFSGVSCQKRIEMNIEWIRMAILVLISKPLNRSFDNTVYRSRPLLRMWFYGTWVGYCGQLLSKDTFGNINVCRNI